MQHPIYFASFWDTLCAISLPNLFEQNVLCLSIFSIFFVNNIQIKCVFEGFLCLTLFFDGYFCLTFFRWRLFLSNLFFFEGYFCLTYFFELPLQIIFVYLRLFFVYTFEGYIVENSLFLSAGYFLPILVYRVLLWTISKRWCFPWFIRWRRSTAFLALAS